MSTLVPDEISIEDPLCDSSIGCMVTLDYVNLLTDVDSGVTFDEDSEKEIDTIEIEEEDWIDYIKRSTADALDKMEHTKIRCWNRTHKKMKWKLALRIATSPSERGLKKKLLNGTQS